MEPRPNAVSDWGLSNERREQLARESMIERLARTMAHRLDNAARSRYWAEQEPSEGVLFSYEENARIERAHVAGMYSAIAIIYGSETGMRVAARTKELRLFQHGGR